MPALTQARATLAMTPVSHLMQALTPGLQTVVSVTQGRVTQAPQMQVLLMPEPPMQALLMQASQMQVRSIQGHSMPAPMRDPLRQTLVLTLARPQMRARRPRCSSGAVVSHLIRQGCCCSQVSGRSHCCAVAASGTRAH